MIQHRSMLKVADNSGAKKLQCIRVLGGYKKRYAIIGDIVTCAVKEAVSAWIGKKRRCGSCSYRSACVTILADQMVPILNLMITPQLSY
jgi:ribosomal protein L14